MKFIYCFFLGLFFTCSLFGQGIGVVDLVKMSKMNKSEIETFLNDKGCVIENIENQNHSTTLIYIHYSPKFWVGISDFTTDCKIFYCDLEDTKYFNSQKKEALKLGFKYSKQNIFNDNKTAKGDTYKSIHNDYIKGKDKISFITQIFNDHIQYEIAYHLSCSDLNN